MFTCFMRYNTVIFDLDGTLLYTVRDLAEAVNYSLRLHGYPTHPEPVIQRMVGNGVGLLMARALPEGFQTADYDAALEDFRQYYSAHSEDHTIPYPGIQTLVKRLKAEGRHTAVVSNKYASAARSLIHTFFGQDIDLVLGDDPALRRKPEPDGILAALKALGADREGAVYVGDTEVDLLSAQNAGLPCICVTWGYRTREELEESGAPLLADSADELWKLL